MLPEELFAIEAVERDTVRDLDEVELRLFREDGVDVGCEVWVGFEEFGADVALDGGFEFGFGTRGEPGRSLG